MYRRWGKKGVDIILVSIGTVVLSPVFIAIALLVKMDSKGPVLFKQKRIGRNKEPFYILKFRTMYIETPKDMATHLLSDPDQFITRTGRFLRKSSLDELPQLFNILKGEMSLVGPRPALWNQIDLIKERDLYKANEIYPGVTGWAQINGRDELAITEKAKLDGEYVQHQSLKFDLECLVRTFTSILKKDGIVEGKPAEQNMHSEAKKMME